MSLKIGELFAGYGGGGMTELLTRPGMPGSEADR